MNLFGTVFVLLLAVVLAAAQNTQLQIYQLGTTATASNALQVAPVGSTLVFSCSIPSLSAYTGSFGYTVLHAQVNGSDVVICSATQSGTCASNSQGAPFQSRSISVSANSNTVGTTFTITNALTIDSMFYYCEITAGNVLYTQPSKFTTQLLVYALPQTPSCSFVGSSNTFLVGSRLPQLQCTGNVGFPSGSLQVLLNGNSAITGSPYFLSLATNTTVQLSNGTFSMTYLYNYLNGSSSTYQLTTSNNNDYFLCYAFNSYTDSVRLPGWASTPLRIEVQFPVQNMTVTANIGLTNFSGSAASGYTVNVFQNTYMALSCGAQGSPSPSYAWTRVSGQNIITFSNQIATGTLSVAETLTLRCNASNTITAATPNYGTSQVVTVTVNVFATPTTAPTTTAAVASAALNGGAIAGIVIGCIVGLAIIILIIIFCVCGMPCKEHPSKSEKPIQSMAVPNSQAVTRSMLYEPEDKKQPLSLISEMDIPYGDGAFDDTARSRRPIVDPHAQSAAEYLDLNSGVNGEPNNGGYNQYTSQPTTPNGNMNNGPPAYPGGSSTLPRGGAYGMQAAPNAYGTMNPYGMHGDGGYNTGTMA